MPDLTPFLPVIVFVHVASAFLFAAGHGISMFVALRLKGERDRTRLAALLDLSAASLNVAMSAALVMLVSGILAGIVGGSFGRAWIWVALVLLVVITGVMTPLGAMHLNRVRLAIGQRPAQLKPDEPDPVPLAPDELAALLASGRMGLLTAIGGGGFLVILWLMMAKPF